MSSRRTGRVPTGWVFTGIAACRHGSGGDNSFATNGDPMQQRDSNGHFTADYWQARADEAMAIRDNMTTDEGRATMRVMAECYLRLAKQARAREGTATDEGAQPK